MGKTGSTAIQRALHSQRHVLAEQQTEYLGLWFSMIDSRFHGVLNGGRFFKQSPQQLRDAAAVFIAVLQKTQSAIGTHTFVMSNESFSNNLPSLYPFIDALRASLEIKIIAYVRNPAAWLPSAYAQWGISDKGNAGPVVGYADRARVLAGQYNGIIDWGDRMGDLIDVRHYDKAGDIVCDFASAAGLRIDTPPQRAYERRPDAELILRAHYNSRFPHRVLPEAFNAVVLGGSYKIPDVQQLVDDCLDYSETSKIIEERSDLWVRFRERFGIDLLDGSIGTPERPDVGALREQLLTYLIELSLTQAEKIHALESRISKLEKS